MQRIPYCSPRGLFQRFIFFFAARVFGEVPKSLAVWSHSRRAFAAATLFELTMMGAKRLPRRARVLADLAAAREIGCRYCLDIGSCVAMEEGLSAEDLRAIHDFESAPEFDESERAVIAFSVAMTQTPPRVDDQLHARLAQYLDSEQIVELAAVVGWEQYRARINHAAGLPPQGFMAAEVCPVPSGDDPGRLLSRVG
jgi:alkylhydroperoxidase family enzyme